VLARFIRSPLFWWHAPGLLLGGIAWLLGAKFLGLVVVACALLSLTFMLIGGRLNRRTSTAVAARYPSAVAHFLMTLTKDADEQVARTGRAPSVVLVITPLALVLLDARSFDVVHEWSWEQVEGVAGHDTAVGSTPAETVVLVLAGTGGRTVELRTFEVRALVSNHIVLSRPARLPWPAPESS